MDKNKCPKSKTKKNFPIKNTYNLYYTHSDTFLPYFS